jgi:hypothetical protein
MTWAVKSTFLQYLARTPGTQVSVGGGVVYTERGEFRFPCSEQIRLGDADVLRFSGDVRFTSHGGLLDVVLAQPAIELSVTTPSMTTGALTFADATGASGPAGRITLAELEWADSGAEQTGRPGCFTLSARLTEPGTELFDGIYPPGERLAPVHVHVGGANDCAHA